jgi:very-short-patch-repair endonuclease
MPNALARVSAVAVEQHSCFTRAQANKEGLSDYQLRTLVRNGVLDKLSPRVFRFTNSAHTWHQRVMAACLDGGDFCVASHRTAAALHKLDGFEPKGIVEVLVPMKVRHRRKDVIVHHTRDLPPFDRTQVASIPVTTVARTLIDLGASSPATIVEEAFDCAERTRAVARTTVERRYNALRKQGRNGIGAMTQVLDSREPFRRIPWSVLERRLRRIFDRAGIEVPTFRYKVRMPDGRDYEMDAAWVPIKFGLEVDGGGAHAPAKKRAADNVRQADLEDEGWMIRRFTYDQVENQERLVATVLRRAFATAQKRI